jgi:hypothetical protein
MLALRANPANIGASRMGSFARFVALAGVTWCGVSGVSSRAHAQEAPSRQQCLAAHERAQDERQSSQLIAARRLLQECAAATCPSLVSRDCVGWLAELDAQIPSVIFRATKDGRDVAALEVREGSKLLTESLSGTPLDLDPGPHRFVATLPGLPTQEATYVLQAGDKARVVAFVFTSPPVVAAPPAPRAVLAPSRPIQPHTYWLGGATLVSAATAGLLGIFALNERHDVKQRCAPLCTERDLGGVKNLALASDVALGLALVGAGLTVYSYAARPTEPSQLAVTWSGTSLVAKGRF